MSQRQGPSKQPATKKHTLSEESSRVLATYYRVKQQYEPFLRPQEEAILKLIDLVDDTRNRWKTAENLQVAAEEQSERLERARTILENQVKTKQSEFLALKGQVSGLENARQVLEEQLLDYESRMATMRATVEENLKNTAGYEKMMNLSQTSRPLSPIQEARRSRHVAIAPIPFADDTSSLNTEEEVQLRYNRVYRRSQSQEPELRHQRVSQTKRTRTSRYDAIDEERENDDPRAQPPSAKRSREQFTDDHITIDTKIMVDPRGRTPTRASVEVRRSKKRSVSASRILEDKPNSARRQLVSRSPRLIAGLSSSDIRKTPKTPTAMGSSWTRGRAIHECTHKFVPLKKSRLYSMIMPSSCTTCNMQIPNVKGAGLTCDDCQINLHDRCKLRAPMPCLPVCVFRQEAVNPKSRLNLIDFCPISPPFIPMLIIRCIYTLEQDRITTEGLYRISGDKTKLDSLYEEFMRNKFIPNMTMQETEVICGTVGKFLRSLRDPLIPRSSYCEFVNAAANENVEKREQDLCNAICDLPLPNQDTLAYLCSHLQKVAAYSSQNKMPIENLATVFAPTLLQNISNSTLDNLGRAEVEIQRQSAVIRSLLSMPTDFWTDYLNKRTITTAPTTFGGVTPRTHHFVDFKSSDLHRGVDQSVLGPISRPPPKDFTPRSRTPGRIPGPF